MNSLWQRGTLLKKQSTPTITNKIQMVDDD